MRNWEEVFKRGKGVIVWVGVNVGVFGAFLL
jgi:hypothetical protein